MKKIISVIQQKGGVGKTTIAVNLAYELQKLLPKLSVTLADADPQKSASLWIERRNKNLNSKINIVSVAPDNTGKNLKKELEILKANIIIVDLPPAIESLSLRAALYSDLMLVPVGASILDIDAAKEAIKVCEEAKDLDSKKNFLLIPTKIQPQTLASKELVQVLSKWGPVAKSHISLRVAFADAALNGMGIGEYAKGSLGAKEIHSLAKETINLIGVKNDKNN